MAVVLYTVPSADNARAASLWCLVVDEGTLVLRYIFDSHISPDTLDNKLYNLYTYTTLNDLRKKKVIVPKDWDKLYPFGAKKPSSEDFDITLLSVLLRNICNLDKKSPFWKDVIPPSFDESVEADISRIRRMKNEFSHMTRAALTKEEYEQKWNETEQAILRLGKGITGLAENIKKRKDCVIDPAHKTQEIKVSSEERTVTNTGTNVDEHDLVIEIQRRKLELEERSYAPGITRVKHNREYSPRKRPMSWA